VNSAADTRIQSLIFYYHRLNRYSFNALAGALDSDPELADVPVRLAKTEEDLAAAAAQALKRHDRAVVALSILTPQLQEVQDQLRQLRSDHGSRITFLAGGPHAAAEAGELVSLGIDLVFRGESEMSFPAVLKRLARGLNCRDIAGTAYLSGDEVVVHPPAHPVDIDSFPSFSPKRGMLGPIEITRGCPFACGFCQTSWIFGVRPRHRSVDNIVRQAQSLLSRPRPVIRLLSPNAFSYGSEDGRQLNLPAIHSLLAALRETVPAGGRIIFGYYPSEVRPEHITPETLDLLRAFADNDEIVIGAQSGSARMLDACCRAHSVDSVLAAVSQARKAGYKVIVDFIFGLPGETPQDVRETLALIGQVSRLGARIHPHAFVPLPQTAFAAERPGRISADVIRALDSLDRQQRIYGDWVEQRRLANRMYRSQNTVSSRRALADFGHQTSD